MSRETSVLIVGSGIAGQTLGAALHKRGIRCEIVELRPEFSVVGAGMYVQGNALRALADIDVVTSLIERGWYREDDVTVIASMTGEVRATPCYPRIASEIPATIHIRRQALHEVLQDKVASLKIPVRMGTSIELINDDTGSDSVTVSFSDGTMGEYDLVIGADGINSAVRATIFPGVESEYSGYSNWRVVLPQPEDVHHATWMQGEGKSFGIIPIGEGKVYIAGVTQEHDDDRITKDRLLPLLQQNFANFGGAVPELLEQVTDPDQIVYTPIGQILMPPPWYKGRVVVVGDAAHASTPFWAQGASMAIEDVIVLAELLEGLEDSHDCASVLPTWMVRRFERCQFVQQGSKQAGDRIHAPPPATPQPPVDPQALAKHIQQDVNARYARLAEPI